MFLQGYTCNIIRLHLYYIPLYYVLTMAETAKHTPEQLAKESLSVGQELHLLGETLDPRYSRKNSLLTITPDEPVQFQHELKDPS